jgi:hypothetical protein
MSSLIRRARTRTSATRPDAGSVTLFLVISVVGLLVLVGLVVDGGAKIRAVKLADSLAAEAGRAGGQAIDVPAAITGEAPTVDRRAAFAAAQNYLRANGVAGTVTVADGGRALDVEVTTRTSTVFLGLIGVNTLSAKGHARVLLVRGVTGATP